MVADIIKSLSSAPPMIVFFIVGALSGGLGILRPKWGVFSRVKKDGWILLTAVGLILMALVVALHFFKDILETVRG